jgi:hypothetical protein
MLAYHNLATLALLLDVRQLLLVQVLVLVAH